MTLGAAYFANENDVAKYIKDLGPLKHEVRQRCVTCCSCTDCSILVIHMSQIRCYGLLGALGVGFWYTRVIMCTTYVCIARGRCRPSEGGTVSPMITFVMNDFITWSSSFANVDFAMISGLRLWADLFMHVSAYDINCQYRINFEKHMEAFRQLTTEFESIPMRIKYFPWTLPGVGKFHLPAHNAFCRYKFSLNLLPGAGMTDGESPERIWASLNALALRTREMASGRRHDVINEFHADWNVRCN